jgi:hypothetical protein
MRYIPLSKGKFAIVDEADFEWLNQWKWTYHSENYAYRHEYYGRENGKYNVRTIYMHRLLITEGIPEHKNNNGLDNRRSNLRSATQQQNMWNRKGQKNTSSVYKGVTKRKEKWEASIKIEGKYKYLGLFEKESEAATAYNMAALRHFREFAHLNEVAA